MMIFYVMIFPFILPLVGLLTLFPAATCFTFPIKNQGATRVAVASLRKQNAGAASDSVSTTNDNENPTSESNVPVIAGVVAPLDYKGPYPCLGLKFPHLDDAVLDFIVDTGANVNSINADLATQFQLTRLEGIPKPLATAGMGGSFAPGDMVVVGDCSLAGLPPEQSHMIFLRNLTAAALPHGSPLNTAGLLGTSFVSSLAGVEFDWYGTDGDPPTFIFYFGKEVPDGATKGMVRVPVQEFFQLLTVTIQINGVDLPALLDTGSPITALSEEAAKRAGVSVVEDTDETERNSKVGVEQSIGDNVLHVGGVDGRPMKVIRSQSPVQIKAGNFSLGEGPVYVGNVPALSFLTSVASGSDKEAPVAILGLDSLRKAYRVILSTGTSCEMWLDELDDSKPIYKSP